MLILQYIKHKPVNIKHTAVRTDTDIWLAVFRQVSQQSTTEIETNKSWQGEKIVKFLQHKLLTLICLTINGKREV